MSNTSEPKKVKNDLQQLLLRAVPENERGNRTLLNLSKLLGISQWAMRKWIIAQRLTPARVKQLVEIGKTGDPSTPDGRVCREDFERFIYND